MAERGGRRQSCRGREERGRIGERKARRARCRRGKELKQWKRRRGRNQTPVAVSQLRPERRTKRTCRSSHRARLRRRPRGLLSRDQAAGRKVGVQLGANNERSLPHAARRWCPIVRCVATARCCLAQRARRRRRRTRAQKLAGTLYPACSRGPAQSARRNIDAVIADLADCDPVIAHNEAPSPSSSLPTRQSGASSSQLRMHVPFQATQSCPPLLNTLHSDGQHPANTCRIDNN